MTNNQRRLLDFISARLALTGVSPSYDEMRQHMGLASKAGINRMVVALERMGAVTRHEGHYRNVQPAEGAPIVRLPMVRITEDAMVSAVTRAGITGKSITDYVSACILYAEEQRS